MSGLSRRQDELEKELLDLDDEAMLLEEFDGFVAGLLVCPELISPNEWLPFVWNRDGEDQQPPFDDLDHANRVFGLIMDHYNDVTFTLMKRPKRYCPLFRLDQRNGDVIWEGWIEGFAQAVSLRPDAWQKLMEADRDTSAAGMGMLMLVGIVSGDHDIPPEQVDSLTEAAPDLIPGWVVTLNTWRIANTRPAPVVEQTPRPPSSAPSRKVGRNEPCPCGSGKKYKRCCGLN